MTEDTRVCPVCKKFPPAGQVWKNFQEHKRYCGIPVTAVKKTPEPQPFPDWFNDLFGGARAQ